MEINSSYKKKLSNFGQHVLSWFMPTSHHCLFTTEQETCRGLHQRKMRDGYFEGEPQMLCGRLKSKGCACLMGTPSKDMLAQGNLQD